MASYPVKLKLVTRDANPTSFTFVGEDTRRPTAPGGAEHVRDCLVAEPVAVIVGLDGGG